MLTIVFFPPAIGDLHRMAQVLNEISDKVVLPPGMVKK